MKSLGYLEVTGLSTAIVAADKMLKTADVELSSVENTKGAGWVTICVTGDVAAVSVAIDTAKDAVGSCYVSSTVIANPADGVDELSVSDAIKGFDKQTPTEEAKPEEVKDNNLNTSDVNTNSTENELKDTKKSKSTKSSKSSKKNNKKK
ncbi:BMC domain-containing protein [Lentilactobacillus kosonis]|uniref:Propanediol utilization polyhedral body protein PduK n=1 Tax=Lentilactobacillus kosonis TaxID=2810561 RepID=A0A401FMQ8_9LACO|nr:BMC domain-containing protein [Lentilactobacillus kosonis]GAY73623.1 propanediol utilization polyhedral body protein PduK [Lentilactobacillus kosonis]